MSLLHSAALSGFPDAAPETPRGTVIVTATCGGCKNTMAFRTDPHKDPFLLGKQKGTCILCGATTDKMTFKVESEEQFLRSQDIIGG